MQSVMQHEHKLRRSENAGRNRKVILCSNNADLGSIISMEKEEEMPKLIEKTESKRSTKLLFFSTSDVK